MLRRPLLQFSKKNCLAEIHAYGCGHLNTYFSPYSTVQYGAVPYLYRTIYIIKLFSSVRHQFICTEIAYLGLRAPEFWNILERIRLFFYNLLNCRNSYWRIYSTLYIISNTKFMCVTCRLFSMHQNIIFCTWVEIGITDTRLQTVFVPVSTSRASLNIYRY